jgi:hypothetical protein
LLGSVGWLGWSARLRGGIGRGRGAGTPVKPLIKFWHFQTLHFVKVPHGPIAGLFPFSRNFSSIGPPKGEFAPPVLWAKKRYNPCSEMGTTLHLKVACLWRPINSKPERIFTSHRLAVAIH